MQKHVERLGDAWGRHWLALDDCLVGLAAANNIVGLDGENLLEHMACSERLKSSNLHLSKSLSTKLCLTAKWLLGNE